jgi:hypothetical protein
MGSGERAGKRASFNRPYLHLPRKSGLKNLSSWSELRSAIPEVPAVHRPVQGDWGQWPLPKVYVLARKFFRTSRCNSRGSGGSPNRLRESGQSPLPYVRFGILFGTSPRDSRIRIVNRLRLELRRVTNQKAHGNSNELPCRRSPWLAVALCEGSSREGRWVWTPKKSKK